jgi:hypothetical protein
VVECTAAGPPRGNEGACPPTFVVRVVDAALALVAADTTAEVSGAGAMGTIIVGAVAVVTKLGTMAEAGGCAAGFVVSVFGRSANQPPNPPRMTAVASPASAKYAFDLFDQEGC